MKNFFQVQACLSLIIAQTAPGEKVSHLSNIFCQNFLLFATFETWKKYYRNIFESLFQNCLVILTKEQIINQTVSLFNRLSLSNVSNQS